MAKLYQTVVAWVPQVALKEIRACSNQLVAWVG